VPLLTYGIESGSASMMKILKKGITHEKVDHAQAVMKKADIPWDAFFMIGSRMTRRRPSKKRWR
jgi:radical SAM superfamily enzyme YgiQ (UPF0313 family)